MKKLASALLFLPLISACNHPIDIVGNGDVVSSTGTRNCVKEDAPCVHKIVGGDQGPYQETYTATPRAGANFDYWENCKATGVTSDGSAGTVPDTVTQNGNQCIYDISAQSVVTQWGNTVPTLRAVFAVATGVTPIHSIVGDSIEDDINCDTSLMPGPSPVGGPSGFNDYLNGSYLNNQGGSPSSCTNNSTIGHNLTFGLNDDSANGGPQFDGQPFMKFEKRDTDPSAPNYNGTQKRDRLEIQTRNIPALGTFNRDSTIRWYKEERYIPSQTGWIAQNPGGSNYIIQWHDSTASQMIRLEMREVRPGVTENKGGLQLMVTEYNNNSGFVKQKFFSDTNVLDYFDKWVTLVIRTKLGHNDGEVDVWVKKGGVLTKLFEFRAGQSETLGADENVKSVKLGSPNSSSFSWMQMGSYMNDASKRSMPYRKFYYRNAAFYEGEQDVNEILGASSNGSSNYGAQLSAKEQRFAGKSSPSITFPESPNVGDLLIAYMAAGDNRTILQPTSGWTEVDTFEGNSHLAGMWYKVSDGTESSFTANFNNPVWGVLRYERYTAEGLNVSGALTGASFASGNLVSNSTSLGSAGNGINGLALGFVGADHHSTIDAAASFSGIFSNQPLYAYSGDLATGLVTSNNVVASADQLTSSYSTSENGDQMVGMLLVIPEQ